MIESILLFDDPEWWYFAWFKV